VTYVNIAIFRFQFDVFGVEVYGVL